RSALSRDRADRHDTVAGARRASLHRRLRPALHRMRQCATREIRSGIHQASRRYSGADPFGAGCDRNAASGGVNGDEQRSRAGHFWWSLYRVFAAFLLACVTAIPVGIAMGVSRIARGVFDPPLEFYRPLPPLAYLPLIVIWFGIEETAKIVLIYLACFAPLAMAARAGVRSVTIEQINAAYSMGASRWQVICHVVIPAALPEILTGMRIAIGFGWTTLVAAEMVAATAGLGQMVLNASNFLRTDVV